MVKLKSSGKKFGTRYGKKLREKISEVEKKKRKLYKCPKCNKLKVKRVFSGVWECGNCGVRIAGKAYSLE